MKFAGQITLTADEVLDALRIHAHKLGVERELVRNMTQNDFLTQSAAHAYGRVGVSGGSQDPEVTISSVDVSWTR